MEEINNNPVPDYPMEDSNKKFVVIFVFSVLLALVAGFIFASYMSNNQSKSLSEDVEKLKSELADNMVIELKNTVEANKDNWKEEEYQRNLAYLSNRTKELQKQLNDTITYYQNNWKPKSRGGGGSSPSPGY